MSQPVTAAQRKFIASLRKASVRREEGLFVIEGTRSVLDTAACFEVVHLVATARWLEEHGGELPAGLPAPLSAKPDEVERMSALATPQGVMAVCRLPKPAPLTLPEEGELMLALDRVQDPGNLGTIVRIADWFGIRRIVASTDTVDLFNPKVIQSTMGAVARVQVVYTPLAAYLAEAAQAGVKVYGTFLDGSDIYAAPLTRGGIVVMGNEGNGISPEVGTTVTERIKIPSFPPGETTVESLNVGMATAITVAEFRRRVLS